MTQKFVAKQSNDVLEDLFDDKLGKIKDVYYQIILDP
eukprot:CAMPEP_0170566116 /NCGR_PEP_ID=MMETSP0211-20121228/79631_1 /TAXON_ID=311385 /ORGANISM="Pseudokeronopsis sp., Strain OXSARD2" /LENGTH=36 /DNA_ID= /DNA_START= /DNA_END= /DNA_ORIENTATION=